MCDAFFRDLACRKEGAGNRARILARPEGALVATGTACFRFCRNSTRGCEMTVVFNAGFVSEASTTAFDVTCLGILDGSGVYSLQLQKLLLLFRCRINDFGSILLQEVPVFMRPAIYKAWARAFHSSMYSCVVIKFLIYSLLGKFSSPVSG